MERASTTIPENEEDDIDMPSEETPLQHERPKRKETPRRSRVWDHFNAYIDNNGKPRAQCKYCEKKTM